MNIFTPFAYFQDGSVTGPADAPINMTLKRKIVGQTCVIAEIEDKGQDIVVRRFNMQVNLSCRHACMLRNDHVDDWYTVVVCDQ